MDQPQEAHCSGRQDKYATARLVFFRDMGNLADTRSGLLLSPGIGEPLARVSPAALQQRLLLPHFILPSLLHHHSFRLCGAQSFG